MASRSASDAGDLAELLLTGGVQAAFPGWGLVRVEGSHRERFLHSQLSSDVAGLPVGGSQLSALLDRSGRLRAFFFLHKRRDRIELLVPEAAMDELCAALEANIIADDVRIARRSLPGLRLALGAEALRLLGEDLEDTERVFPVTAFASRGFVTWGSTPLPLPEVDVASLEPLRVLGGPPRWGLEAVAGMLINETTLVDGAVSFTKGCFLGQETVAKVRSHRGAARAPALLELDGARVGEGIALGWSFAVGDRARAGVVRSRVVWSETAYLEVLLHRSLRVDGMEVRCVLEDGSTVDGTVRLPPLLTPPAPADHAQALYRRAGEAFTADREAEAIRLLERAIAVHPAHADSYESLGVILGRHGEFERAIAAMQRLLAVEPDSVMAHSNMSVYYNRLGRIEDAEREAAAAAMAAMARRQREQERAEAEERTTVRRREELRRREDMFRQVLELDPDDALGNFGMGELCVESGRYEDAVQHLEKALEVDRAYSAAYLALGRAWEGMRRAERAREVYRTGVEVATGRGDLATANKIQQRLQGLLAEAS